MPPRISSAVLFFLKLSLLLCAMIDALKHEGDWPNRMLDCKITGNLFMVMRSPVIGLIILSAFLIICIRTADAADVYEIEVAHNDEVFVINGEVYEAKLYCLGWDKGESVIFLSGSPYGVCVSAELFNLDRRESCDVWCE